MGIGGRDVRARLSGGVVLLSLLVGACGAGGPDLFEGAAEGDPVELVGTWATEAGTTWEVTDETITASGGAVNGTVESTYEADGTTLRMNDIAGDDICDNALTGTYDWVVADDQLALRVVSDACGGRGIALNGLTFNRQ